MTEQLRFDQVLRNRGAVNLDEPLARPKTVLVDRARDQFLPDPALTQQEHRRVGGGRSANGLGDLPERWALPDHLVANVRGLPPRSVLVLQAVPVEGIPNRDAHALAGQRFLQEIERPQLGRLDRRADGPMTRDHHDRQDFVEISDPPQRLEPVHARHLDVEKHEVWGLSLDERDPFLPGWCQQTLVPVVLEDHPERLPDGQFIVDDENARLHQMAIDSDVTTSLNDEGRKARSRLRVSSSAWRVAVLRPAPSSFSGGARSLHRL